MAGINVRFCSQGFHLSEKVNKVIETVNTLYVEYFIAAQQFFLIYFVPAVIRLHLS